MRKGLFPLLGLAVLLALALALIPATSFAATTTNVAKSSSPHIFSSKDSSHSVKSALKRIQADSVHAATTNSLYSDFDITYQGGPVMTGTTQVYAIFWEPTGNVSANYNNLIKQFFGDIGSSPLYQSLQQYPDAQGHFTSNSTLAGSWVDTGSYPESPLLDTDIQNEVTHAQTVNGWSSGSDNLFAVFLERNTGLCVDSSQTECTPNIANPEAFCAYHSSYGTSNTIYAALPYAASPNFNNECSINASPNGDDADQTINVTSHEQIEAATDPLGNAWYNNDSNSPVFLSEVADLCAWTFGPSNSHGADVTWNNDNYIVQQEWSNAVTGCVLTGSTAARYYQITNRNSGLVADVFGGGTTNAAQVIQFTNHLGANQQWDLVPDGPFYQIVNRNSGLVMDVFGGGTTNAANVIQFTNHNGFNQQWELVPDGDYDVIVNVNSGLVMDVFGGGTTNAAHVIQFTFHNGLNQQWSLTPLNPYYEIQNVNSNLAMDVFGGGKTVGAHVIQFTFHSGLNQQWALIPDGNNYQIENLNSGLVLDVTGGGKNAGAQVIQWTNHNGLNQQWTLVKDGTTSGGATIYQIVNVNSGLVLDVFGGGTTNAANVIQFTNHNGTNQQWVLTPTSA